MTRQLHLQLVDGHENVTAIIEASVGLFRLGGIAVTPGVKGAMSPEEYLGFLLRHSTGDWGECDQNTREANDVALREGGRIHSVFRTIRGSLFWVITDSNRELTISLLPEEY